MSTCRGCGAQIVWIRTAGGRSMPCDAHVVTWRADAAGPDMVVTPDGQVVRARIVRGEGSGSIGYISHFATCPRSGDFRRR